MARTFDKNRYGRRVLITGASSGIGKACALAFARRGCAVTGVSRSGGTGKYSDGRTQTFRGGGSITMVRADVTDEEAVRKVCLAEGPFDIAVLAAGMGIAGPAEEVSDELARKQMDVNYFGVLNVCRAVVPPMRERGCGLIVIVSSIAGKVPIPMQSHYSSSKYALEAYAAALRMEVARFGVRVSLLEPGDTKTGFTDARVSREAEESAYAGVYEASVAKMEHDERHGKSPGSVARAALRLAAKKHPPVRAAVGLDYKALMVLLRILPDRAAEKILMKLYLPSVKEE